MTLSVFFILVLTGLLAGFAGGVMGIGGALIMIPAMIYLLGMSQHDAQGTSLATMLAPIGILAVLNYYKAGHVNIKYAVIIMVAFVVGSWFGSKWAVNIPAKTLKQVFGVLLILIASKMIFGK